MRNLLYALLLPALALSSIPWPVSPTDSTHNLYHSYGDYHHAWLQANPDTFNFHSGIDFAIPQNESDDVYVVETGTIKDMPTPLRAVDEYYFVICHADTTDQGWMYGHLNNELGWGYGDQFIVGDHLASMHPGVTPVHLHFMRSSAQYDPKDAGLRNPLQSLSPAPTGGFWNFMSVLPCRFVADHDIGYWEGNWTNPSSIDSIPRTELQDAVDILHGFSVWTSGDVHHQSDYHWVSPRRIEWEMQEWDGAGWTTVEDISGQPFERKVFDFDGQLGASSDYEKYKQAYFLHDVVQWLGTGYPEGDFICLTNCGDDISWNGISNIQEGSWETDCKKDLSGPTNNPALQLTPDGQYRLVSTAYAWDLTVSQESVVELELHNSSPIASAATIADQADGAVWEAEWQVVQTDRGLDAEFVVLTNQSVQLGQTLDATVVFSEPMNTSSVEITAGKAPGYNDLTVTTTEWTCTNNPEPCYDTWNGTIEVPAEGCSGWITLKVEGEDSDGNCLKDPAGAFDERSYSDTYHGFGIAFGPEAGWPATISDKSYGSPCLADVDGDGDLDVIVLCDDGYLEVLDDDGSALVGWQ